MTIAIIGAFDRYNYGDLLFPIILEETIKRHIDNPKIEFFALADSDLRQYGGKSTQSLSAMKRKLDRKEISHVIVSGGDVLSSTWHEMHLNLVTSAWESLGLRAARKVLGQTLSDRFSSRAFGCSRLVLPWIMGKYWTGIGVRTLYNTVGGSTLANLPDSYQAQIVNDLNTADFISFRDDDIRDELIRLGLTQKSAVAPDSAIVISDIMPFDTLSTHASESTTSMLSAYTSGYIVFQVNKYRGLPNIEEIKTQIESIYRSHGLPCVLLSIGRAAGHDDEIALRAIANALTTPCKLVNEGSIYDTLLILSRAECFVGTSLHGVITALSYGVPYVGLDPRVRKLDSFLRKWGVDAHKGCVEYNAISSSISAALSYSRTSRVEHKEYLAAKYREVSGELNAQLIDRS